MVGVTAMFVGMRLFYGAWPWESRKTWYHTKAFVPVMAPPDSETKEIMADTDSDHFDRKLIAADIVFIRLKSLCENSRHRRSVRILDLDPGLGGPGAIRRIEPFRDKSSRPRSQTTANISAPWPSTYR